ncbi:TPA: hypothetical protein I8271_003743 [Kluyvera intermedia]|uniref:Uncharacterized protein n=2 Tax=Enterobacteriaceae TaxID=543 RepID=A0AAC8TLG2_9ENTR|nr:hypothetical protein [Phytobacter ursingii]HAT2203354.1 hypothetical protein [Kluyvera intermedia]AKL11390.1 hypothetical protein AB182_08760 [Phytobacter ursingii]HAT2514067.1 hypothetical protein [Kluyvera intermedia]HAT2681677.1 hypothetical protein [Kluyvera intermedia]HAT2698347.1 hypothetical protein [Kluyvera intermedia]
MKHKIESMRMSPTEVGESVNGEFKAPDGAFLTSINTETGSFTYSYFEVEIDESWYPISVMSGL